MPSTLEMDQVISTDESFIENFYDVKIDDDYLMHHGTRGQKWYKRQYQYEDGSLTPLGRIHYGVGPAREKIGKVASSAGAVIRKKIKPTNEDLKEKYEKLQEKDRLKKERAELKKGIKEIKHPTKQKGPKNMNDMTDQEIQDEINRHRNMETLQAYRNNADKSIAGNKKYKNKKIEKMSDQEIQNEINRHRNEEALRAYRESRKPEVVRMIGKAAKEGMSQAVGNTVRNVGTKVGDRIAGQFDSKESKIGKAAQMYRDLETIKNLKDKEAAKLKREAQKVRDKQVIDDYKKEKSEADKIKEEAEMRKNSKAAYEAQLQEEALRGNADAKQKLSDFKNATKGDYDPKKEGFVNVEGEYETPESNKSNKSSSAEDVRSNGFEYVTDTVEDVPRSKNRSSNTKFVDLDEGDTYEPPGKSSTEDFMRSWMSKDIDSTVEDVNPDASDYIYDQGNTKWPPDNER